MLVPSSPFEVVFSDISDAFFRFSDESLSVGFFGLSFVESIACFSCFVVVFFFLFFFFFFFFFFLFCFFCFFFLFCCLLYCIILFFFFFIYYRISSIIFIFRFISSFNN